MLGSFLTFTACVFLIATEYTFVASTNFDRNFFGVNFSPYVMTAQYNESNPDVSTYTIDNLKTLLEVVSTRFSKIKTCCADTDDGVYVTNLTSYNGTNIGVRTAEAAALINRDRNNKSLTVLIGVYSKDWEESLQWHTSVNIATEAAKVANTIYAGTVEGIYFCRFDTSSMSWANSTLSGIRKLRNMTKDLALAIGTQQYCHDLSPNQSSDSNAISKGIWTVRRQIVLESDFIICLRSQSNDDIGLEGENSFVNMFSGMRKNVAYINPRIRVMFATISPIQANLTSAINLRPFQKYWEEANDFAKDHEIITFMESAFDSIEQNTPNNGWWRLTSNKLINNASGYIEKISLLHVPKPTFSAADVNNASLNTQTWPTSRVPSNCPNSNETLKAHLPPFPTIVYIQTRRYESSKCAVLAGILGVIIVGGLVFFIVKRCKRFRSSNVEQAQVTSYE